MKCFLCLHAFECRSLDEMVGANGACFVAFEAARGAGFGSREDRGHEKRFDVSSVSFAYHGDFWQGQLHAFATV